MLLNFGREIFLRVSRTIMKIPEQIKQELRLSVWDGTVSLRVQFDEKDRANLPACPPQISFDDFYGTVSRCGYFSFYLKEFVRFVLRDVLDDSGFSLSDVWLEYRGLPLKWHLPIGHLFDVFTGQEETLPDFGWNITLRYGNYPSDKLFRGFQPSSLSSSPSSDFFMALNKESSYLRHGTAKKIMNLSKEDQMQLWDSLLSSNFEGFWSIQDKLNDYDLPPESHAAPYSEDTNFPRHVPVRLYVLDKGLGDRPLDYPLPLQNLVHPIVNEEASLEKGKCIAATLLDAVNAILSLDLDKASCPVLSIHGIALDPATPLLWAYLNLMYPDGFLHLILNQSKISC
ncbi:autophagy protein 5, variant 3 [Entomophthora muscae]|uniref:Autophagy protein 5, variant 3 n=1 Tax=Entomophthora muscae TaxID=34485 RepID=A0ACC2U3Y9_9FUNG|nr:autophagy protein 5, variant 3 [Entomophthora muscae]